MSTGSEKGKWLLVLLVVVVAGLGGFYAGRPDLVEGLLSSIRGDAVPELAASHVKVGYVDLRRDSYASIDKAIDNFEKAVALAPGYAGAMAALSEGHIARAEYMAEQAEELTAQLEQKKEEDEQLAKKVAELQKDAKRRRDEAFKYGSQALKIDADGLAPNRAMADYYRLTGASEQMVTMLAKAEAAKPDDAGVAYVRGSAAVDDGAAAERAVRYLDGCLERAPRFQRARYKLAQVHYLQGDRAAARIQLEALLGSVPDHERARALLAQLGEQKAKPQIDADKDPERRGRALDPEEVNERNLERLFNRAERLRRADYPERALPVYHEALSLAPDDDDVLVGIGWCHLDMEQPTTAISYFNRGRAIFADNPEAHMGLAEAYVMKGMKRDAVRFYRRYLEISPYGTEADVARRMLKRLQQ